MLTLNLSARLRRSLATTNAAESLLRRMRHVKRNAKRWRSGQMMLRWVAAGVWRRWSMKQLTAPTLPATAQAIFAAIA